ncbi:MAG: type II toxin-antitoxin system VapC family toxin [Thermosynechococcaceae cyanobacterium]
MTQYILDTDHVSLILLNHPQVTAIAAQEQITVTIITVQELFNGWVGRINNPSQVNNLPALYSKFSTTVKYLQTIEILDFTIQADQCLRELLRENPLLRKSRLQKDMRIAAIALTLGATVVTRNRRDFELVPGIELADWTLV